MRVRSVVVSIAAAVIGLVWMGATSAPASGAAAPLEANAPAHLHDLPTPPVLLAQLPVHPTPVAASAAPTPSIVAQTAIPRAVQPEGGHPGVLWLLAIGALLYRFGARVLRA